MSEAIDLKDVLERVQNDKELLLELLDIYQEDFAKRRKALGEAIKNKDFNGIKESAHSLKGSSGNISAKGMFAHCLKLEQMAKDNDLSQAPEVLKAIDQEFVQLADHSREIKKYFGK